MSFISWILLGLVATARQLQLMRSGTNVYLMTSPFCLKSDCSSLTAILKRIISVKILITSGPLNITKTKQEKMDSHQQQKTAQIDALDWCSQRDI